MSSIYGIIGYPLSHSFSPGYFNKKFQEENIDAVYQLFPLQDIGMFPQLLAAHPDLRGLNVTIPYKTTVIPFLHHIDETARAIGAVNCIDIRNGILTGYNTDCSGFEQSLLPLLKPYHKHCLVLGTGGASLAVIYVLQKLGISYTLVSRNKTDKTLTYDELTPELIVQHTVIINTSPLGMYPDIDSYPDIPYSAITNRHLLYDLVYNPGQTLFLEKGKAKGAQIRNGLEMLLLQAEAGWDIWNRTGYPTV